VLIAAQHMSPQAALEFENPEAERYLESLLGAFGECEPTTGFG
jgi:hypothetical protein